MSRLYSFVAHHYLSPLQCGLQTAHAVAELSIFDQFSKEGQVFRDWTINGKTIIILGAGNHAGVQAAYEELVAFGKQFDLPRALFEEDEASMNGMSTAAAIVLPSKFYDVKFFENDSEPYYQFHDVETLRTETYFEDTPEFEFINWLKSFRTA